MYSCACPGGQLLQSSLFSDVLVTRALALKRQPSRPPASMRYPSCRWGGASKHPSLTYLSALGFFGPVCRECVGSVPHRYHVALTPDHLSQTQANRLVSRCPSLCTLALRASNLSERSVAKRDAMHACRQMYGPLCRQAMGEAFHLWKPSSSRCNVLHPHTHDGSSGFCIACISRLTTHPLHPYHSQLSHVGRMMPFYLRG